MKLWLDDNRPAPRGWVGVKTATEAIEYLAFCEVEHAHLDHDLGGDYIGPGPDGMSGMSVIDWMEYFNRWPKRITIHSHNPYRGPQMHLIALKYTSSRYDPYDPSDFAR